MIIIAVIIMSIRTYLVLLSKILCSDSPAIATLGEEECENSGEKLIVVVCEGDDDIQKFSKKILSNETFAGYWVVVCEGNDDIHDRDKNPLRAQYCYCEFCFRIALSSLSVRPSQL